jgi:hypothetical protein
MQLACVPRAAWLLLVTAAALSGCAYEPPKPGLYAGYGNPPADITCTYEAPTGSNFVVRRCRRAEDMAADAERARELADRQKVPMPDIR